MIKPKKNKSHSRPCDSTRVMQAISILKQLNQKFYEKTEKKSLLDDESQNPIILQLTMKKIPPKTMQKFIRVRLPMPIVNEKSEVCLIVGDLDKRNTKAEVEPDVDHYKELLKRESISQVNEVITLRQLRKEYKSYEGRRQLCGAFDVFLCDKKIAGVLPSTLGKSFFQKRKLPIQINMKTTKLKEQIENALSSAVFHISCRGNSCASEVANLSMTGENILSNVMSSIEVLKEQLPGQWDNVLGIYVKTPKSKAIPLYMSNDNPNDFKFGEKKRKPNAVTAELSTLPHSEVKVFRDGRVFIKKQREDSSESDNDIEESSNESEGENIKSSKADKVEKKTFNLELNESGTKTEITEENCNYSGAEKLEKKHKKRKSNLKLEEDSIEVEVVEEKVESSKAEKPEKKNKKRKSDFKGNEDVTKVEVIEEKVENSEAEKPNKKNKKRKSNFELNEDSADIEVIEEKTEKHEKKKRVSNLELNEEDTVVEELENAKAVSPQKKNKKRKSNKEFNEEMFEIEVKDEEIQNAQVVKIEKKSENQKSDLVPKKENVRSLSVKMKSKHKKQ